MKIDRNEIKSIESEPQKNLVLQEVRLFQNYPNPFSVTTFISFTIPQTNGRGVVLQHVTLKIFNAEGHEMSVLVNDNRPPGYYDVEFDCEELSSGVYYYELVVGSYQREVKKMFVLK